MSGEGSPTAHYQTQPFDCHDLRVAVLAASWHEQVMGGLIAGALRALDDFKVEQPEVVRVPGSFELPVVAKALAEKGYEVVVALGVVIRGGTPHFDYVAGQAASGVSAVGASTDVPVVFGVLTTDSIEQAIERAGTKAGNKGWDAAMTALEMVDLFARLEGRP